MVKYPLRLDLWTLWTFGVRRPAVMASTQVETGDRSSPQLSLSLSTTLSEDSEDVVLVRVDGGGLVMATTPGSEPDASRTASNLESCKEESSNSNSPAESPRTEGEATSAEATMPTDLEGDATGRMTDELEAEFEAYLRAQTEGGEVADDITMDEDCLYEMDITVTEPVKQGEGMSSYLAYLVTTKTNMPQFRSPEVSVRRKYADYQALQAKLTNTHLKRGCLLPQLPESSTLATTVGSAMGVARVRAIQPQAHSSSTCAATDGVERRRAALQRYLNRVASHPVLRRDADFHEFLQTEGEISKPVASSVMSGEGVTKLLRGVTNAIAKVMAKMSESDEWFDDKHKQYEALGKNLKSLHTALEGLAADRQDLANTSSALCRGVEILSHCEQDSSFSQTLAQFATVHENIQQIRLKQVDTDFFVMSEMVKDHLFMLGSIRACFQQRILAFQTWHDSQGSLQKKRDEETKLLVAKTLRRDKVDYCRGEIGRWEVRVENGQKEFQSISKAVQDEITLYETERLKEFRTALIQYLEKLMRHQQQMNKHWEELLSIAKATPPPEPPL